MKRSIHAVGYSGTIAVALLVIVLTLLANTAKAEQAYEFSPSGKGKNYKKLVHNILGFSIDMPSAWTFGVNGNPPTTVIVLYPNGMNTGKLSKDYEMIEIGNISFIDTTLEQAQQAVMRGMHAKHPSLKLVQKPKRMTLNGMSAISWIFEWPSKTGYTVVEYVTLAESAFGIRSLVIRTTNTNYSSKLVFYNDILTSFRPFKPKY